MRDEAEHKADSDAVEGGARRCRDAAGVNARRQGTAAISVLLVLLGLAVIVRTIQAGVGGGLGLVIGVLLLAAGALRLYLTMVSPAADRAKPGRRRRGEHSR